MRTCVATSFRGSKVLAKPTRFLSLLEANKTLARRIDQLRFMSTPVKQLAFLFSKNHWLLRNAGPHPQNNHRPCSDRCSLSAVDRSLPDELRSQLRTCEPDPSVLPG